MQSLLDIIGATIIGGLLMITMFTSMITIQENNRNLRGEMQIIEDIEHLSSLMNNYYMDKVGYELPIGTEAFPKAEADEVWFNTQIEEGDNTIYQVKIFTGTEDVDFGYPLTIEVVGGETISNVWLSAPLSYIYYDVNGNVLDYATLANAPARASIRSIETILNVFHGDYSSSSVHSRALVFRKYFPNLAI